VIVAGGLAKVTAAILAGGLGTRLRPTVADRPKVLAPVRGRPYLAFLLDQLAEAGLSEVVLLTGFQAEQVQTTFGDRYAGMRLVYSPEPSPLGTGGALRLGLPRFSYATALVLNGDSYCDVDLPSFYAFHCRHAAEVSLVSSRVADTSRFGKVHLAADGRILGFAEKQAAGGAGWINAGIYLLERSLIETISPDRPVSLERDLLPSWAGCRRVFGFSGGTRFLDIGTPESYQAADSFFAPPQKGESDPPVQKDAA
jgi:NDP-sugar pyrophosphorylase family protein